MGGLARIVGSMNALGGIQNGQRRTARLDGQIVRKQNHGASSSFRFSSDNSDLII